MLAVWNGAGPLAPALKVFKPKFPLIPQLQNYKKLAGDEFWQQFPINLQCPAKIVINGLPGPLPIYTGQYKKKTFSPDSRKQIYFFYKKKLSCRGVEKVLLSHGG